MAEGFGKVAVDVCYCGSISKKIILVFVSLQARRDSNGKHVSSEFNYFAKVNKVILSELGCCVYIIMESRVSEGEWAYRSTSSGQNARIPVITISPNFATSTVGLVDKGRPGFHALILSG